MAQKGERKIPKEKIITILQERLIVSANEIADLLEVNYLTAQKRLEELIGEGIILTKHKTGKNTVRRYKLDSELSLSENAIKTPDN